MPMSGQHKSLFLEVSNLTFKFEDDSLLKNISFNINENENIFILGPSGSGKSTLAYCLNNLYPDSIGGIKTGSIQYKGREISSFAPGEINQKIGLVMQDPDSQFCMLTVEEELIFVLENIRLPRTEFEQRIHNALGLVDMLPMKKCVIQTLSGGQKQKFAIACALAMDPEMLILDEPTANLDPASSLELVRTLKSLKEQRPISILVIEHNLDYWQDFMDRCLILNTEGELIFDGPDEICFSDYAEMLTKEGIWLPRAVDAGLRLRNAGLLTTSSLPVTIAELIKKTDDFQRCLQLLSAKENRKRDDHSAFIFETNGVSYVKTNKAIIENISLSIKEGEFIAIAGSNGSGKTTFSKCLSGLLEFEGEIKFYGKWLDDWLETSKWRKMGYVFQNPEHQFITDSVKEEIFYSLKELNKHERNDRLKEILKLLRMEDKEYSHPLSLSQGQKRRLSVATMLINGQEVILLDEPTFGQDANTAKELIALIKNSLPKTGCIIMITHDMDIIEQHADKVLVMDGGKMLFYDTPDLLWSQSDLLARANLRLPFVKELEMYLEGSYLAK
jgi:energy-coupling factor transport system ATP-binding protein